jgi:nucleotide-binding universal stress UspA family protein
MITDSDSHRSSATTDSHQHRRLRRARSGGAEGGGHPAEEGVRIAHEAGLEADATAVKAAGAVSKTILQIAGRDDAAAIVTGSRGLAVSNAVVHHAERPTLVIHVPTNDAVHTHEPRS